MISIYNIQAYCLAVFWMPTSLPNVSRRAKLSPKGHQNNSKWTNTQPISKVRRGEVEVPHII